MIANAKAILFVFGLLLICAGLFVINSALGVIGLGVAMVMVAMILEHEGI
ncbi:hypothetical protein PGH26_13640 [Sporosarcina jeotgali]|uniref:Uncharacterized protein n=1 Tax=Sporosarcina jeotgali TaxID=3020056 RepID=A0ABZ0KX26_9BACL|nr:hypothetical protein [Sporosarcina sp. B2O-1]WOV83907.1 hypothetical protein PGH26_13640 [Sporosarcina sp. B2O-1]